MANYLYLLNKACACAGNMEKLSELDIFPKVNKKKYCAKVNTGWTLRNDANLKFQKRRMP